MYARILAQWNILAQSSILHQLHVIQIPVFIVLICLPPGPQHRKQKLLPFTNVFHIDKKHFLKENHLPYKEQSLLNSDIKSYCRQTYIFAWNLLLHAMYLCTWDWLTPYMPVHVKVPPTTIVQKVCLCRGLGLKLQSEGKSKQVQNMKIFPLWEDLNSYKKKHLHTYSINNKSSFNLARFWTFRYMKPELRESNFQTQSWNPDLVKHSNLSKGEA